MIESKKFWSWFGGFIDGEGSIIVTTAGKKHQYTRIRLSVSNTHRPTIDYIYKQLSGNWRIQDHNKYKKKNKYYRIKKISLKRIGVYNWRKSFRLTWNNDSAREILKRLVPYLITKRTQAKLALKISTPRKRYHLTTHSKKLNLNTMQLVKDLNRREYV